MSTSLVELSTEMARNLYTDLSGNLVPNIAFSWQDPADFVKDITNYKSEGVSDVMDLSGAKIRWAQLEKELQQAKDELFSKPSIVEGSNINWGRISQSNELEGAILTDPGMYRVYTYDKQQAIARDIIKKHNLLDKETYDKIYETGELTAPIVKAIEEEEDTENTWPCKGCSKYFATKASLKRHHDRKKSCKELCEKQDISGTVLEVPDKPYIVEWIEQLQTKAISGGTDTPYCKHCDVEFANKANLNKHLSKSVACDKLAKQEFLHLLTSKSQ